jgi:hypothetical protein
VRPERVTHEHRGAEVEREQLVPARQPQVEEGDREIRAAGVVDHDVHVT